MITTTRTRTMRLGRLALALSYTSKAQDAYAEWGYDLGIKSESEMLPLPTTRMQRLWDRLAALLG